MVYVSWHDGVAYAEWAGARLLTEQEWEKAARGIDGRVYPWGDEFDPAWCNTNESGIRTTTPVGRYSPTGDSLCGCADMVSNVWEWTANQILRCGSFDDSRIYARAAFRYEYPPDGHNWDTGFRVGMTAPAVGTTEALNEDEDTEE